MLELLCDVVILEDVNYPEIQNHVVHFTSLVWEKKTATSEEIRVKFAPSGCLLCPGWHVGTQSNQSFPEKLKKNVGTRH